MLYLILYSFLLFFDSFYSKGYFAILRRKITLYIG